MEIPKITPIQKSVEVGPRNNQSNQSNQREGQNQIDSGKEPSKKRLDDAVKDLNIAAEQSQIQVNFKLHDKSGEYYVQLIDSKTNEVIQEIPSKKILDYFANMKELLGLILDKHV